MVYLHLFTYLLIACSPLLFANENNLVVKLNVEENLLPVYVVEASTKAPFEQAYLSKLWSILRFDLNHNGMTKVSTNEKRWDGMVDLATQLSDDEWRQFPFRGFIKLSFHENKLQGEMGDCTKRALKSFQGLALTGNLNEDRKMMHQIADTFHQELFQKPGIASSKILYTVKKDNKWASEIWEADYDGHNARQVIEGGYFVTPSYIPAKPGFTSNSIVYTGYKTGQPKIYVANLNERTGRRFSLMRGNQLMPTVSPQRDQMAFVCDVGGNPDLFIQSFSLDKGVQGKARQIFSCGQAVQGSPTFSHDGQRLAFVSNKDGFARIYLLEIPQEHAHIKDVKPKLLTKYSRESTAPAWSPDGSKIAYCSLTQGVRQIWIYDLTKQEEKQVTFGKGHKENPSWSANSRMLVYNCIETDTSELYLTGLNQKDPTKIGQNAGELRYPSWSK